MPERPKVRSAGRLPRLLRNQILHQSHRPVTHVASDISRSDGKGGIPWRRLVSIWTVRRAVQETGAEGCDSETLTRWNAAFPKVDDVRAPKAPPEWSSEGKEVARLVRQATLRGRVVLASACVILFGAPLVFAGVRAQGAGLFVVTAGYLWAAAILTVSFGLPVLFRWLLMIGYEDGYLKFRPSRNRFALAIICLGVPASLAQGAWLMSSSLSLRLAQDLARLPWDKAKASPLFSQNAAAGPSSNDSLGMPHQVDDRFLGAYLVIGSVYLLIVLILWAAATIVASMFKRSRLRADYRLGVSLQLVQALHHLDQPGSSRCLPRHRSCAIESLNQAAECLESWTRAEFRMADPGRQRDSDRAGFLASERIRSWSLRLAQLPNEDQLRALEVEIRQFLSALTRGFVQAGGESTPATARPILSIAGLWELGRSILGSLAPLAFLSVLDRWQKLPPDVPVETLWTGTLLWAMFGIVVAVDSSFDRKLGLAHSVAELLSRVANTIGRRGNTPSGASVAS